LENDCGEEGLRQPMRRTYPQKANTGDEKGFDPKQGKLFDAKNCN